jgi:poly(beta-D-mannuronate) lyase
LKASFTSGTLQLSGAAHVVVEGFSFSGGGGARISNSSHCRISRSRFVLGSGTFIVVDGNSDSTRIDRNELGPKNSDGNLIGPTGLSTRTRIDRNYLHDVSPGGNGRETLRLGCCGAQFDVHDTFNVVEHNLFVNCSGEAEIITVKSSSNTIRYNTFRQSRGNVTLRAGKRGAIHGNFMFGNGIRLYDEDHKIFNNYVEGSPGPAVIVGSGQPPANAQTRRAFIVHNTLIGTGALFGHGGRPLGDLETTFANNIIQAPGAAIRFSTASVNPRYQGNIVFGGSVGVTAGEEAFRLLDPQLATAGGVLAIGAASPAVNAAPVAFPFVTEDLQGQPRDPAGLADVGADELSAAPGRWRPLTPADVGPDAP